ncbi:MAG: L,D-transpeptidase family protein [Desulfobulbaceae bacterium]|nr:L,D-transpeptidase family protein [Desulfobulbaceae bacterium]HIJ91181.1 L,D-transpeptidase family protein [Deltaproteobacteria bacterium]
MSFATNLFRLCCFALIVSLLFASAPAAAETPTPLGELCLLPALEKSLAQYQQLADQGGWVRVPDGPSLHEGDANERISLLKKRLLTSGDLAATTAQGDHFDTPLMEAVQRFQTRHGLTADGVVGPNTLAALNVPISERIRQLTASLERCQPLPQLLEPRHILVNIADFTLKLFENGKPVLSMPVIVGKTYRQTPVFTGRIATLVLNPNWEVPHSIATKDLLPKIQKDPGYLAQLHLRVFRDRKQSAAIDPATVDWTKLTQEHFPYRLSQPSGPDNALGQVKFLFPNPYDVYLHDTPARELFQKDSRTFSSGCIRVAKPLDLAVYLLKGTKLGTMDSLTAAITRKKTQYINIPAPIAIHIVYMTAWVDSEGTVQFRPDIYHRNPVL